MYEELLARAKNGEKEAENEIFRNLFVSFRLLAGHRVGEKDIAEDIAQKSCMTVLERYKTENFTVSFEAWAYGILRMNIKHYLGRNPTARQVPLDNEILERIKIGQPVEVESNCRQRLLQCLHQMMTRNPRYARILNLVHQGFKSDEICEKLNISRNNFYVILNRAREMLWSCYNEEGN